jgi:ABC-type polysaccharide/polyol phosphate transport system ATPase subunit
MIQNKDFFIKLNNINLDIANFNPEFRLINSKKKIKIHQKILKNITLEIKNGEKLGIIGPNGAGKSTLLRLIAEIYKPTSGIYEKKGKINT